MIVKPILAEDIDAVGHFLNEHLNPRISAQAWGASLRQPWLSEPPNHGMQLVTPEGERVGVLLALYSEQLVDGRVERFCNPHSWCVLDKYRHASIGLVLAIVRQRGWQFTMFTPNPKVAQVFQGLKFTVLDPSLLYFPNLPGIARSAGSFVEARPERIGSCLGGAARQEYETHKHLPWLRFVAFGTEQDAVLAIYKPGRWKKMPCAMLSHVSDASLAVHHGSLLRRHLLAQGFLVSRIEARFLTAAPPLALRTQRGQPKLALVKGLSGAQVRDVYSELMALDI